MVTTDKNYPLIINTCYS